MKIWIINQYASLPTSGIGGRHRHLARELAARGHDVSIIAARRSHLTRDVDAADAAAQVEHFEGFRFVRLDLLRYQHGHDKKRFFNWFLFAIKLLTVRRLLRHNPDVVIYSSPSLVGYLAAERIARRYQARLIFEVRDIWPLTLVEIGGFSDRHPVIRLFQWIEGRAYRHADLVISNLRGAVDHMRMRGLPDGHFAWIANGISLTDIAEKEPAPKALLAKIPTGKFTVGYAGTMGSANSIDTLIEAAHLLRNNPEIVFVLLGDGKDRHALEERVRREGLERVLFLGAVSKVHVLDVIARFDACWIGTRASPLYNYGIAANKIFDSLLAGRPILFSFNGKYDPVADYEAGITVPAEDAVSLVNAILVIRSLPHEKRRQMGENGRRGVLAHHEYGRLAERLEALISPDAQ